MAPESPEVATSTVFLWQEHLGIGRNDQLGQFRFEIHATGNGDTLVNPSSPFDWYFVFFVAIKTVIYEDHLIPPFPTTLW